MKLTRRGLLAGLLGLPAVALMGREKPSATYATVTTANSENVFHSTQRYTLADHDFAMGNTTVAQWMVPGPYSGVTRIVHMRPDGTILGHMNLEGNDYVNWKMAT